MVLVQECIPDHRADLPVAFVGAKLVQTGQD